MEILDANKDTPKEFHWGVQFRKDKGEPAKPGPRTGGVTINSMVDSLDVWESLFAKSMQLQLVISDGLGFKETSGIQPGDFIDMVLLKTDKLPKKIDKTFRIMSIVAGTASPNLSGKRYFILAVTEPAILNKVSLINKAYSGKLTDIVKSVCEEYLKIAPDKLKIEESTNEKKNVVMPAARPFKMIDWCATQAISSEGGEDNSFYLFYENSDGFKLKTTRQIIKDANDAVDGAEVWKYTLMGDASPIGNEKDVYRILEFNKNKATSASARLDEGSHENETLEFDFLKRARTSKKTDFSVDWKKFMNLGTFPVVDVKNNFDSLRQEGGDAGEKKSMGTLAKLKIRSSESSFGENNSQGRKHHALIIQQSMFNQLSYTLQFEGNPQMRAGDLIDIQAKENTVNKEKEEDRYLTGKFLIGNVRHQISGMDKLLTVVDVFKDGYEYEDTPK